MISIRVTEKHKNESIVVNGEGISQTSEALVKEVLSKGWDPDNLVFDSSEVITWNKKE